MKFTFIYLISTIECMYIVNSFDIGAVSEAEAQKRGGAGARAPPSQSQKCSYQGPYLNFFLGGQGLPNPLDWRSTPPPLEICFSAPLGRGRPGKVPLPPPAPNPSLPVLMCLNLCLPPPPRI